MINTFGSWDQFDFLTSHKDKQLIKLRKASIRKIISTPLLSVGEKIEILEMHLGLRFLTEASSSIKYVVAEDGYLYPEPESIDGLQTFLNKLPLPTSISERKSERKKKLITQVNIFANQALKDYYSMYEHETSALEVGLLYGYHPKAILAFCEYIPSTPPKKITQSYQYFNSKVYPADFYDEVDAYHKQNWEELGKHFPEIIELAEEDFAKNKHKLS